MKLSEYLDRNGLTVSEFFDMKKREAEGKTTLRDYDVKQRDSLYRLGDEVDDLNESIQSLGTGWKSPQQLTDTKSRLESVIGKLSSAKNYATRSGLSEDYIKGLGDAYDAYSGVLAGFGDLEKYYGQFKSEDDYASALKSSEEAEKKRSEMLSYDLVAGEEELNSMNAYLAKAKSAKSNRYKGTYKDINGRNRHEEFSASERAENIHNALDGSGYNSIYELENAIAEKTYYYNQAKFMQDSKKLYDDARNAEDFAYYSAQGAAIENPSIGDVGDTRVFFIPISRGQEIGNIVTYSRDNDAMLRIAAAHGSNTLGDLLYSNMEDEEVEVYNYYLAKENAGEVETGTAQKYLDSIYDTLTQREASALAGRLEGKTGLEIVFGIGAGLDQFSSGIKNLFNTQDEYISPSLAQYASGMIRDDLSDNGPNILGSSLGQIAYDTVTTTANMLPTIFASALVSSFATPAIGSIVGTSLMGASAAGNAYAELLNAGMNKNQARALSIALGVWEGASEYYLGSIEGLSGKYIAKALDKTKLSQTLKLAANGLVKGLADGFVDMATEGLEEVIQDIGESVIKGVMTGEWEFSNAEELAYNFTLGALSAGMLNGPMAVAGEAANIYTASGIKNTEGAVENLKKIGSSFSADTVAYKLAGKVNDQTGVFKIAQLFREVNATLSDQNKSDISFELQKNGMSKKDADTISEWLAKALDGDVFTKEQAKALEDNPIISRVFKKVIIDRNSTVNQRIQGVIDINGENGTSGVDLSSIYRNENNAMKNVTESLSAKQRASDILTGKRDYSDDISERLISEIPLQIAKKYIFLSNEDGKTTNRKTGEAVTFASNSIASNNNGVMTLKLDNGETMNAVDADFATKGEAYLYATIADMGVEPGIANSLVNSIAGTDNNRMISAANGLRDAYWYGATGVNYAELENGVFTSKLTDAQRKIAYNLGKKSAIDEETKKSKSEYKKSSTPKGEYKVSDKGVEGKKFSNLNKQQKSGLDAARILAAAGLNIYVFESTESQRSAGKENGSYISADGSIHIDMNSGLNGEGLVAFTVAHEFTHFMEDASPAKFKAYADILFAELGVDNRTVSKDLRVERERLGKIAEYEGMSENKLRDIAYSEVVAKYSERMFTDTDALQRIAEKIGQTDKTLLQKIVDFFKGLVERLRAAYEGFKSNSSLGDAAIETIKRVEAIRDAFVDAAVDALQNYRNVTESKLKPEDGNVSFSLRENNNITDRSVEYYNSHKNGSASHISEKMFNEANNIINDMTSYMLPYLDITNNNGKRYLPEEILGKTTFSNGSYGRTIENTTICYRTLAYIDFTNEIKKRIGRPLTVEESFLASQMLYDIAKDPQCLYCYVSLDRKAYDGFLLDYIDQRDDVIDKFAKLEDKSKKNIEKLYTEFLAGRKDTKPMRSRFNLWINSAINGKGLISLSDLTTEEERSNLKNGELAAQINDAERYAQSASWAKKLEQYRSYNSDILRMSESIVKNLNAHYGLRFYSFSEYTPAFIVENMQQIRDASLKGLYGLAYTKKTDFARIFANTGMNINISVFGKMVNGKVVADTRQGADWGEVQELRNQYKNVGAVFVATSDDLTEWALAQDWIDVVIPFHIVRTGANVAEFYKWTNNTKFQADVDKSGKNKTISPSEHHNDLATFKRLVAERELTPRFAQFIDNPNYMKLVNETRLADTESTKLTPNFTEETLTAAKKSFDDFVNDGGYYGDWYNDGIDYEKAVKTVAEDVLAGKRANEVEYGRQDIDIDEQKRKIDLYKKNPSSASHGNLFSVRNESDGKPIVDDNGKVVARGTVRLADLKATFTMFNKDKDVAKLADKVFDTFETIQDYKRVSSFDYPYEITIRSPEEYYKHAPLNSAAVFTRNKSVISNAGVSYNMDAINRSDDQRKANIILHELIHACTYDAIELAGRTYERNTQIGKSIDPIESISEDMFDSAKGGLALLQIYFNIASQDGKLAGNNEYYGLTSPYEMVAELSNVKFREYLKKKSLLTRIFEAIKRIFGIKNNTSYESANAALYKILTDVYDRNVAFIERKGFDRNKFDSQNDDIRYSIRSDYASELDAWDGETTGFSFTIGKTSDALVKAGLPRKTIKLDATKVLNTLKKHSGMSIDVFKKIPNLLENPIVVIDSKSNPNSKIVMGDLYDKNGKIVTIVLLLTPTSKNGNVLDLIKISSSEGRGHIESLFKKEGGNLVKIRYVDEKRIQNWLNANRLQLPLRSFNLDSTESIAEYDGKVNTFVENSLKESIKKINADNPDVKYSARDSEGNTLSKEQQKFFENSKVRDENGNLLVVYHGTPIGGFTVFNANSSLVADKPSIANWFTTNLEIVNKYYNVSRRDSPTENQIYTGYLNVANPLVIDAHGDGWNQIKVSDDIRDSMNIRYRHPITDEVYLADRVNTERLAKYAKDNNYDGLIIKNVRDGSIKDNPSDVYAVFNSSQFKNIDNKTPTSDPDIRYSDREGMSNRELLANALADAAVNDDERIKVHRYKVKIGLMEQEEKRLSEIKSKIKELSFAKGKRDMERIRSLQETARSIESKINAYDKELLRLEATESLKKVLEREREKVRKSEDAKYREAIASYKQRTAEKVRDIVQANRDSRLRASERRKKTEIRNKIKAIAEDFRKRLTDRGTGNHYVPRGLVSEIIKVCEMIDPTGIDQDTNAAQKFISGKQALRDLKAEYDSLKSTDSYDFSSEFREEFSDNIEQLADTVGNIPLRDMSLEQLEDTYDIIHDISFMLKYATRQIGIDEAISNYEAGNEVIYNMNDVIRMGLTTSNVASFLRNWMENPMRAVREMSGFDDNSRLVKLFAALNEGRRKMEDFRMRATKEFDALRATKEDREKFNDAVEKPFDFGLFDINGKPLKMSKMQAIQIVLTYNREKANDGRKHLQSGVVIPDVELQRKGKFIDAFDNAQRTGIVDDAFIAKIMSKLSEWDKKYMETARKFFNETAKDAINEYTLLTRGRIIAQEKEYIPYIVNKDEIAVDSDIVKLDATIDGMGIMKSVQKNAPQQIVINGLNLVIDKHIKDTAKVYGLGVPVRNFNKVFNMKQTAGDGGRNVKEAIRSAWKDGGLKIVQDSVAELQSTKKSDTNALIASVKSAFVVSTLASNLSVWMKQAASYPTAGSILSSKSLYSKNAVSVFTMKPSEIDKLFAEIDNNTSQHWIRRQGLSTQELGEINQSAGWQNRLNERLGNLSPMKWIQAMDVSTTAALWVACKNEVNGTWNGEKETDSYWKAVTDLYNRVIEETQPMYDSLHRSQVTKANGLRNIIMFQTQPLQNSGIIRDAVMEYRASKRRYGKDSAELKASRRKLNKAITSQLTSHFVFTTMTLIAAAVLHKMKPYKDDEDELKFGSLIGEFFKQYGENVFGALIPVIGGYVTSVIDKIMSNSRYTIISDPTLEKLNSTIDKFNTSIHNPSYKSISDLIIDIATYLGIPAGNVRNIIDGVIMHIKDLVNGEFLSFKSEVWE